MVKRFINDDAGYLKWVLANPDSFIVNADHDYRSPVYPMIHRATHKLLSTGKNGNWTTGRFFKVCGNRGELEQWALAVRRRKLTQCKSCM